MKWLLVFIIIVVLLVAGFVFFRRFQLQRHREVTLANLQTEVAQTGSLTATVGAASQVRSNKTTTLVWQTSGMVAQVNAKVEEQVTAR